MRIDSQRDGLIAEWVRREFEPQKVAAAVLALGIRAWPTKVAAKLGRKVPDEIWDPQAVAASAAVQLLYRNKLRALRDELAGGSRRLERRPDEPPC